jgi:hypothetical protein
MAEVVPLPSIRDRLRDLNTKAYYLLVALSFIYGRSSSGSMYLRAALCLSAVAAVLPVQDFITSKFWLEVLRWGKIACLFGALSSTCLLGFMYRQTLN